MQDGLLPLFPLQVVLFPGAQLPLHIFEERYKEMIQEVLQEHEEFGVVMANEKGIVSIGCTATVDTVLRKYPDGRLDILTRGRRRFEIERLNDDRSFLRGQVEFFDDEPDTPSEPALRASAIEGFNEFQKLASNDLLEPAGASDPQLSFRLAQAVNDLTFRQLLLVSRSEADRIRRLAEFFPSHLARERHSQRVKDAAPRNGHGKPPGGFG
ncbi:MAG TPA: LON peptidase substrate-binding domain-containing protein [Bryobacteraceae bacterium]|nr:LON peptidase substrate-binding domain-containing protein [Bryobacteraceae bacterium]